MRTKQVEIGIYLPWAVADPDGRMCAAEASNAARRAEECGFASVWAADHLLAPSSGYGVGFLDPFMLLAAGAAVTRRVTLGTGILLAPLRPIPFLMKEVCTLANLAPGRVEVGMGVGWYRPDYDLLGLTFGNRGALLDQVLANLSDKTWYARFGLPERSVRIAVAGGGRASGAEGADPATMQPRVLRRILAVNGWIARPLATLAQVERDHRMIVERLKPTGKSANFRMTHAVFVDLPWRNSQEEAGSLDRIRRVCGGERPLDVMAACVVRGRLADMVRQLMPRVQLAPSAILLQPIWFPPDYVERLSPLVEALREVGAS